MILDQGGQADSSPIREPKLWLVGVGVGLTALLVYVRSLAPTLTWVHSVDGGDLITAARVLGVPHPPGYPLYVLIGHVWSYLPWPAGNLALGFNLLSALCAAAAAALLATVIARCTSPFAGLLGGLTFAFGSIAWSQAIIAEVYAFNSLLLAALFLTLLTHRAGRTLGGLLWGLSWSSHLTSTLFFPLVWWRGRERADSGRERWRFLSGLVLGLSLFLLPPLLAARRPVINWGDPVTPSRWWWLVSGALYRGYPFGLALDDWPGRLSALARFAAQQFTWPGLGLFLWGLAQTWARRRSLCMALVASAALITFWSLGYDTTDSYVLLIPVSMVVAFLIGVGASELIRTQPAVRPWRWLALLIPLTLLLGGWSDVSLRGEREAADFGRRIMAEAPPDALIYSSTDAHTFALWYYRHAEKLRPDLTIVDQDMLGEEWYGKMLRAQDPRWPDHLSGRPVCTLSQAGELDCEN